MMHFRDGWFFRRTPDGAVRIQIRDYDPDESRALDDAEIITELEIMPEEWASIVSSMSVDGEDEASWGLIHLYHQGGMDKAMEAVFIAMAQVADKHVQSIEKEKRRGSLYGGLTVLLLAISFAIIWIAVKTW
jgi:hypothetical protein